MSNGNPFENLRSGLDPVKIRKSLVHESVWDLSGAHQTVPAVASIKVDEQYTEPQPWSLHQIRFSLLSQDPAIPKLDPPAPIAVFHCEARFYISSI